MQEIRATRERTKRTLPFQSGPADGRLPMPGIAHDLADHLTPPSGLSPLGIIGLAENGWLTCCGSCTNSCSRRRFPNAQPTHSHPVNRTSWAASSKDCSNRDVAKQFSLSGETVMRHLSNVFDKTESRPVWSWRCLPSRIRCSPCRLEPYSVVVFPFRVIARDTAASSTITTVSFLTGQVKSDVGGHLGIDLIQVVRFFDVVLMWSVCFVSLGASWCSAMGRSSFYDSLRVDEWRVTGNVPEYHRGQAGEGVGLRWSSFFIGPPLYLGRGWRPDWSGFCAGG
jgi:hypothetical protein